MHVSAIDPVLAAPARLAILATLADGRPWLFSQLREETGLADGNLHVQTRRLAEGAYVTVSKARRGGRPVTCYELTEAGRQALGELTRRLEAALAGPTTDWDRQAKLPARLKAASDDSRFW
jgi:DNA-binding transcriptional ArsR family regulator